MENKALNDIKICSVEMLVERPSPQKGRFGGLFVEMGVAFLKFSEMKSPGGIDPVRALFG